jgi:hypothetical protein
VTLCHQVSTFQRILLLSFSDSCSPNVPCVAMLYLMMKPLRFSKTWVNSCTMTVYFSSDLKLHSHHYANLNSSIIFTLTSCYKYYVSINIIIQLSLPDTVVIFIPINFVPSEWTVASRKAVRCTVYCWNCNAEHLPKKNLVFSICGRNITLT